MNESLYFMDIWGVGAKSATKLNQLGMHTALDFYKADIGIIETLLGML